MSEKSSSSPRLMSLDVLRGFDMMWIVGGDSLAGALGRMGDNHLLKGFAEQLEHVEWAGFRFYDMIFPLFVFIVGVSLVFSLSKALEQHGRGGAIGRIVRRFVLLFALALIYSGGVANEWPNIRLLGVLNRIALCYLFASLLFCFLSWRGLAAVAAGLLVGYWALMSFAPFPDVRPVDATGQVLSERLTATNTTQLNFQSERRLHGVFEPGLNLAHYIDQKYLPGKKWDKTWDPEGILSTLPAIANCLLGVLAGLWLRNRRVPGPTHARWLIGCGVASVILGFLWGTQFPIIKKIWSSSFVLVACGYGAVLLGVFYLVIDVWNRRGWCQPFVWIGMNSITVYMAENIVGFRRVATRFLGGDVKQFFDTHLTSGFGDLMLSFGELGLAFAFCYWLYRRKIFLRV